MHELVNDDHRMIEDRDANFVLKILVRPRLVQEQNHQRATTSTTFLKNRDGSDSIRAQRSMG